MRRSVVQRIAPLLAGVALTALLGCEESPSPGPSGPPGPAGEPVEQPEEPLQPEEQPQPPRLNRARVTISSTPPGAHITINGDTGNTHTPSTLDLPPGTHDLTIHKRGAGTARGSVVVDTETGSNLHITLDSTETDRFPTLRGPRGDASTWTFKVDRGQSITYLPLGQGGDPPLTMQFENLPPGITYEQVTYTDTSGFTGPSLEIGGQPTRDGTFAGSYQVVDNDGDTFSFPVSIEVLPNPQEPEQPMPLPVVSFATSGGIDVWDTVGAVNTRILLSAPAPQPLTINLGGAVEGFYSHPSTVSVAKGSTSATVTITVYSGNSTGYVRIYEGSGYVVGEPHVFYLSIFSKPQLVQDSRCPYPTLYRLLDRVSAVGTLCVTGTTAVSQTALDRVSRASATMLQHRSDLARILSSLPDTSWPLHWQQYFPPFAVVFGPLDDCSSFPAAYDDICGERSYPRSFYGNYVSCPEVDMPVCVHELAHAVYGATSFSPEQQVVMDRFAESDIRDLWGGYALTNSHEFFAEMSTIYFCVPVPGSTRPHLICAEELKEYDPATYEVIHGVYRGSADLR